MARNDPEFEEKAARAGKTPVEAVHEASIERFRPIIMTTLAALMGAIPMPSDSARTGLRVNHWLDLSRSSRRLSIDHPVCDSSTLPLHGEPAGCIWLVTVS